jgi:uncharacterized protein
LTAVARGPVRLREQVPADHPMWNDAGFELEGPLRVDLEASSVGEGILVRGQIEGTVAADCRRCLSEAPVKLQDRVDMLFEPLSDTEEEELAGEVYPLPERGDELNLSEALREQVLLRIPDYVLCSEDCRGLCPQCGTDLNRAECDCAPQAEPTAWDALKKIKFD